LQALWYVREAGDEVARRFRDPKLRALRSFAVEQPFQRFLIFYREDGATLQAVRLMDGARDLPRRLVEPPGSGTV